MIFFKCPNCGAECQVMDELRGRRVACYACDAKFNVPQDSEEPVVAPPAPTVVSCPPPASNKIVISFDDIPSGAATGTPPAPRKLSPRQRRLYADAENMWKRFRTFPYIHLEESFGDPPEKYIVSFHVKGIERIKNDSPVYRSIHRVEIKLPGTYPRTPPTCRMLTPIFHPNIEPAVICIGDHWTAGERLCDLVVRIGEIITYQSYNNRSPLDGEAAMWADQHEHILPIDNRDLMPPDEE